MINFSWMLVSCGSPGSRADYSGVFVGVRTDLGRPVVGRCILKVQARKMEQKCQILQVQTLRENLTGVGVQLCRPTASVHRDDQAAGVG